MKDMKEYNRVTKKHSATSRYAVREIEKERAHTQKTYC